MRLVPSGQYGTSWAWLCRVMRKPWAAATDPGRPGRPCGPSEPGGPGYPRWPGIQIHSYFTNGKKKKSVLDLMFSFTYQADRKVRCLPFCQVVHQNREDPPSLDFQVHLVGLSVGSNKGSFNRWPRFVVLTTKLLVMGWNRCAYAQNYN